MTDRAALLKRFDELHTVETVRAICRDAPDEAIAKAIARTEYLQEEVRTKGRLVANGPPAFVLIEE